MKNALGKEVSKAYIMFSVEFHWYNPWSNTGKRGIWRFAAVGTEENREALMQIGMEDIGDFVITFIVRFE
jgi:hypothetical protein